MRLTQAYVQYLKERNDAAAIAQMATALSDSAHSTEADLLRQLHTKGAGWTVMQGGPFAGGRVYLGEGLPVDARAGELWFDPCELGVMLLVPRPIDPDEDQLTETMRKRLTPYLGWLALRPVARWQMAAFLRLAKLQPQRQQLTAPYAYLDGTRLTPAPETALLTSISPTEALLYCNWLGKHCASQYLLAEAYAMLGAAEFQRLWGNSRREWVGFAGWEPTLAIAVSPATLHQDPRDEADADAVPEESLRMLYDEWATPPDVSFRTEVPSSLGLIREQGSGSSLTMEPSRLSAPLARFA